MAATEVLIERGYRRTQMADVARAAGIAKGTLYGYVESKEALLDWALRSADPDGEPTTPEQLPWRTPERGATAAYVLGRLRRELDGSSLARVVGAGNGTVAELDWIVRDLFRRSSRHRVAIRLVDRCAADHPELGAVWFQTGRWAQVQLLAEHLERHGYAAGVDPRIAARFAIESIALWAVHRHWDPAPQPLDDSVVESAVVDLVLGGVLGRNGD